MGVKCPECDKELSNKQGLAGHLYGIHGRRIGLKADLQKANETAEEALDVACTNTQIIADIGRAIQKSNEERLDKIEEKVDRVVDKIYGFEIIEKSDLTQYRKLLAKDKVKD